MTVRDMVRFIYSGRCSDLADKSDLLLAAADKYDIKDLKTLCCQHLAANLSADQVKFTISIDRGFGLKERKNICIIIR